MDRTVERKHGLMREISARGWGQILSVYTHSLKSVSLSLTLSRKLFLISLYTVNSLVFPRTLFSLIFMNLTFLQNIFI